MPLSGRVERASVSHWISLAGDTVIYFSAFERGQLTG